MRHRQGLRFGIWVDWTQAGLDTEPGALNARDPKVRDWLVTDVPPTGSRRSSKVRPSTWRSRREDYAQCEVKRIVESYHLDMLEHDGYLVAQGCVRDGSSARPARSAAQCA